MNRTGQWRFTPPTHVVAAFLEALRLYELEGGQAARLARYTQNRDTLVKGMRALGFESLLGDLWLSPIIITFFSPAHPNFHFETFYTVMKEQGFIIYPGKLTIVDSFRMGCIGQMDSDVMIKAVAAVAHALDRLGIDSGAPSADALQERKVLQA